ncbi:hypothetical protein BKA56DRAFT_310856 [Ilyonectria sp. MPI-CAGE-AT-0026]|nr:hypothetical protein BKA56DRAFT_310856 [Ilyonectria sp. MPI-CAGE-AT-0026]
MSEFEGEDAVELFTSRAKEAHCNNSKLLKRLMKETKRACLPSWTESNTKGPLYEMLPTVGKIQRAFEPEKVRSLLYCHCRLCGIEDDDESVREFDQMVSNGNIFRPDNIKGLAGLIFCGCLFALKAFCEPRHPLSTLVGRSFLDKPLPPSLRQELRSRQPHIFRHWGPGTLDASADDDPENALQRSGDSLERAFRDAIMLWGKVVNVPILEASTQCEDRTTQNVPIILQQRISPVSSRRNPNVSVSFYLSRIEPGCARLRGHEPYFARSTTIGLTKMTTFNALSWRPILASHWRQEITGA